ncbi:hypothetical protein NDU88_009153 [Pleurodeles waltl]|uniref:Uncharacterized protein n=1 Tax=Pleurodeles waltl TaxID=8319 RepID=A0AAV7PRA4_PLEWA|nr:hypothetical protein NDU88_009153 [Pleurodeles waltl]
MLASLSSLHSNGSGCGDALACVGSGTLVRLVLESRCRWPSALLLLFPVREGRRPPAGRESSPPVRSTPPEGGPEGTPGPCVHPGTRSPAATPDQGRSITASQTPGPGAGTSEARPRGETWPKAPTAASPRDAVTSPWQGGHGELSGVLDYSRGDSLKAARPRASCCSSRMRPSRKPRRPRGRAPADRPTSRAHRSPGPLAPDPPGDPTGKPSGATSPSRTRLADRELAPPDPKLQARLAPSDPAVDYGAIGSYFCFLGGCPRHEGGSLTILVPTGEQDTRQEGGPRAELFAQASAPAAILATPREEFVLI